MNFCTPMWFFIVYCLGVVTGFWVLGAFYNGKEKVKKETEAWQNSKGSK